MSGSKEDLCDKEFIKKWVEPNGVKRWQEYVLGIVTALTRARSGGKDLRSPCGDDCRIRPAIRPQQAGYLNTAWSLGRQFWGENGIRLRCICRL